MKTIITDYHSAEADIRQVRDQVFVVEQQIDRDLEFDDRDFVCRHAVAYHAEVPVATGRVDLEKGGKVGRVAVLREFRRQGYGRQVMLALEEAAGQHQCSEVWFHAQLSAVSFYLALGYRIDGPEFEEANIPHVVMRKALN